MEVVNYCSTLMVMGPKGCGKTSGLLLLAFQLRKENKEVYYIDLGMLKTATDVLQDLQDSQLTKRPILLIDNVQLIQNIHGKFPLDRFVYPNVVAACSPGYNHKDLKPFRKERGDGKVYPLYLRPLCYDDALALLRCTFPIINVEESDSGSQTQATLPITTFTRENFMQLLYVTGGVPRYLVDYCRGGNHNLMQHELSCQLDDVLQDLSPERVCELVVRLETMRVSPPNPLIKYGIAYVDQNNQVRIASPQYLDYALHHNDFVIETKGDWHKLERLAIFNIRFQTCDAENCDKKTIMLPAPTKFIVQKNIGELSGDDIQTESVTLIELAPDHPVIDLLLVDRRAKDTEVYFIQTSFSRYSNHSKKRDDLATTNLTNDKDSKTVADHYKECLEYNNEYFIYATPEFKHKCLDKEVYFLDLRRQVFC